MENNMVLTEEQLEVVKEHLDSENKDKELLEKASEATDAMSEEEIKLEEINEGYNDYKEALNPYGLSDEDIAEFIPIMNNYKNNPNNINGLYSSLPDKLKTIANIFSRDPENPTRKISKDKTAAILIQNFINDAKMGKAIDDYTADVNKAIAEMNEEYNAILSESINSIFDRIDDIRAEDPEKAAKLESIKAAMNKSTDYKIVEDYISRFNKKFIIKKLLNRHNDHTFYFNKNVNHTSIKIPDISELFEIIKSNLSEFSDDTIKIFISGMALALAELEIDDKENIANLAFVYKMVSNIYSYKFIIKDEKKYDEVFGGIRSVLEVINTKLEEV